MKFSTYEEMGKEIAEKALDEYIYEGKTLREWVKILKEEQTIHLDDETLLPVQQTNTAECYKAHEMIEDRLHCRNCGLEKVITGYWKEYNYCPNCGAKMKEREDE